MITAYAAAAGSAEGQVGICKLEQGIINAAAAKRNIVKNFVYIRPVV